MEKIVKTLIISVVSIVALIVTSVTLITIFRPDADITQILAVLAPTIASLGAIGAAALVKGDTAKMTNGFMDAKIQHNVRMVMKDEVLDHSPAVEEIVSASERDL